MTFHEEHEDHVTFLESDLKLTNNLFTGRLRKDEETIKWLDKQQLLICDRALLNLNRSRTHITKYWHRYMEENWVVKRERLGMEEKAYAA